MACQKHGIHFVPVCRWCNQARSDAERRAAQHALRREKREKRERQARLQKARRLAERDARRLRKLDAAKAFADLEASLVVDPPRRYPDRPLGPDLVAVLREIVREFKGGR